MCHALQTLFARRVQKRANASDEGGLRPLHIYMVLRPKRKGGTSSTPNGDDGWRVAQQTDGVAMNANVTDKANYLRTHGIDSLYRLAINPNWTREKITLNASEQVTQTFWCTRAMTPSTTQLKGLQWWSIGLMDYRKSINKCWSDNATQWVKSTFALIHFAGVFQAADRDH